MATVPNSDRPFDLAKLDFEGIRLRRRKRMLIIMTPLAILALIIALKLLSLSVCTTQALRAAEQQHYDQALQWLMPLTIANVIEPYKVHYNRGIIYYEQQSYAQSEQAFWHALELHNGDSECDIRINLALSIEKQADAYQQKNDLDNAVVKYDEVKAVLLDSQVACNIDLQTGETKNNDNPRNEQQQTKETEINQRIAKKSDDIKQARNKDTSKTTKNSGENQGVPNNKQLQKIEQQSKEQAVLHAEQQRNKELSSSTYEETTTERTTEDIYW